MNPGNKYNFVIRTNTFLICFIVYFCGITKILIITRTENVSFVLARIIPEHASKKLTFATSDEI